MCYDWKDKRILLGNQYIGKDCPVFIIAEMSANHLMDYNRAVEIIRAAKKAGADAIKLQTYTPDTITINSNKKYFHIEQGTIWDGTTFYSLYQEAYTPWEWQPKLMEEANRIGLICFSSPFDFTAIDFMEEMNMPAYKIASFEINDIPLIRKAAKTGKPIILSTGIACEEDIYLALKTCKEEKNNNVILLKCTTAYPAPYEDMNLNVIPDMAQRFQKVVGLSDHSIGSSIAVAAVSLGAKVIEKHLTLSRKDGGADAAFSMEPEEFKQMVQEIRKVEKALGRATYELTEKQLNSKKHSRSLFVAEDIKKGATFTTKNLRSIRPGYGMHTKFYDSILGEKASADIECGTPLMWELVQDSCSVKENVIKRCECRVAVIIGASEEAIFAMKEAKKSGLFVVAFDGNKEAKGLSYADISYVLDIRKPEMLFSILDSFQDKIEVVLPAPMGRVLISSAMVNERYQLKGVMPIAADYCTDKYLFHRLLKENGLRKAECILVKAGLERAVTPQKFPVIVKPRYGSGSRAVYEVKTETELKEIFDKDIPYSEDFLIETAVEGEEYGVDAAIIDGIFYLVLLRKKILTLPPIKQCIGYFSIVENEKNSTFIGQVKDVISKAAKLMNLNNCILHADMLDTKEDIFIIEISARPSGHYLHNIFTPMATGINMIKEYLRYVTGKPYCLLPSKTKHLLIHYFTFENCYIQKLPKEEMLRERFPLLEYQCNIKEEYLEEIVDGHSIMNRGYFILEGTTEEKLLEQASELLNCFEIRKVK